MGGEGGRAGASPGAGGGPAWLRVGTELNPRKGSRADWSGPLPRDRGWGGLLRSAEQKGATEQGGSHGGPASRVLTPGFCGGDPQGGGGGQGPLSLGVHGEGWQGPGTLNLAWYP